MASILIIEDDVKVQRLISDILEEEGYKTIEVGDGKKAIQEVRKSLPDLVLLDIGLPDIDGITVLKNIKEIKKDIIVIIVSGYKSIDQAVQAMKLGAYDYVSKPFNNEELLLVIKKALRTQYLSKEVDILRKRLYEKQGAEKVLGNSIQIQKVLNQVNLIAPTNMSVIIQGKSGTGKEVFANMIHQKSNRKNKPFIAVDCGAIPDTLVESELFGYEKGAFTGADTNKKGKFELANEGTLLLDEITNLSVDGQSKLLRAIEQKSIQPVGGKKAIKVDVRIISTTNLDLLKETQKGYFRDDLYHRIDEFIIFLPELKEREEDIPILAKEFLSEANIDFDKKIESFSKDAIDKLLDYDWPGNVRELKNVVKRAVLLTETNKVFPQSLYLDINEKRPETEIQLPGILNNKTSYNEIINNVERELIKRALETSAGNKTKAAKTLKIDRKALYRKMSKLGLL